MSILRFQQYDATSSKQQYLIVKHHWCKGVSTCYDYRKFGKISSINEGVIAFSKKVHYFLDTRVWWFKTNDVVSKRFVKISNVIISNMPIFIVKK